MVRLGNKHCSRLRALLGELEAGGIGMKISASNACELLDRITVTDEAARYRTLIAGEVTDDITPFPTKGHYATYNATAPIEVSSAGNPRHRMNLRGNRILNHAIHIAAVTQPRHDTNGRIYFDKKTAEGKTPKEAIRALKRRVSDAVYKSLTNDATKTTS